MRVQLRDFNPCGPMHDAGVRTEEIWEVSPWLRGPVGLGEGGMGGREGREGRGTTALSLARSAGGEKPT